MPLLTLEKSEVGDDPRPISETTASKYKSLILRCAFSVFKSSQ